MKMFNFDQNFIEFSMRVKLTTIIQQAIIWANIDLVYWRIYVSFGVNELRLEQLVCLRIYMCHSASMG